MKLYSRAWVRRVQQQGALPARSWRNRLAHFSLKEGWARWLATIFLFFMSASALWPKVNLHLLTAWLMTLIFFRAGQMVQFFSLASLTPPFHSIRPFLSLPVNDASAFAFSRNRVIRLSSWLAIDVLAFFLATSAGGFFWPKIVWLAAVILLIWATHLPLAVLLALCISFILKRWPRCGLWAWLLGLFLFVVTVGGNLPTQQNRPPPLFEMFNVAMQKGTPMGWATSWAQWTLSRSDSLASPAPPPTTAAGLALLLLSTPWSYRALRRRFVFRNSDDTGGLLSKPDEKTNGQPSPKEDYALVKSAILSRDWLSLPDEKQLGWIERLIWKGFTPRQKTVAFDFVHRDANWSQLYLVSWASLGTLSLTSWLVRFWHPPEAVAFVLGLLGFFTLAMQIPPFNGGIPGMETSASLSNGKAALASLLPVGISELRALFTRAAYFRHLLAFPAFLWLGVLIAAFAAGSWTEGLFPAFVLWLASLAITPCWFIFKISPQTRDTRTSVWLTCTIFGAGLLGAGLLLALFFISLNSPWWFSFVHLLLLALYVRGFETLYLYWYRRGRFDLIAPVPSR